VGADQDKAGQLSAKSPQQSQTWTAHPEMVIAKILARFWPRFDPIPASFVAVT